MLNRNLVDKDNMALLGSPAFLLISLMALLFGSWFAIHQIAAVYAGGLGTYPKLFFSITFLKCYLTIIAFYLLAERLLRSISAGKLTPLPIAVSYLPITFVYLHYPLLLIVGLILFLQGFLLLSVLTKNDYSRLKSTYLMNGVVLGLFVLLHLFFSTRFSPLHWNMSILVADGLDTEPVPVLTTLLQQFVLAKQFSFSQVDYAQWSGLMHSPFLINSPLLQLIAFIFNLPSASYEAFHITLMTLYFLLFVLGSFGFYLFLKYAAKVHTLFAVWGGFLFCCSAAPIVSVTFKIDNGVLFAPYAVFPYALLLISWAFEKDNIAYAIWAGLALASQLFVYAPHPEGLLYSGLFYGFFAVGLSLFTKDLSYQRKRNLVMSSLLIFIALAAFDVVPILADSIMHNMYVVGHQGDIVAASLTDILYYITLSLIILPIVSLLLLVRKRLTPVYLAMVFMTCSTLLLFLLAKDVHLMKMLVKWLHFGFHFWYYWRLSLYFCLAVFTVFIVGLEAATEWVFELLTRKSFIPARSTVT